MRGLVIKDLRLMLHQKNFFLIIAAISAAIAIFGEDYTFAIGFLTAVISLFVLSTISYDQFDNCEDFLFTLPISRENYAKEKYCLGLLLMACAWVLGIAISVAATFIRGKFDITELMIFAFAVLPLVIVLLSLIIPFHLKFGGENGRIAIMGFIGAVVVAGIIINNAASAFFGSDIASFLDRLKPSGVGAFIGALYAAAIVFVLISVRISIGIMRKKEF